jgi:Spy/CpxP family protein refolding chaperone
MKKVLTASFFFAIGLAFYSVVVSAQVPIGRTPAQTNNAQVRPPVSPAGQRGVNRPLGVPQLGRNRPLGPNQIKKQQLQQRLMQAIGLTSEQRMRMQEIRRGHVDELAAAGRRLRQSRQALDQAIMSEPYSEADVRRATEALAAAQADRIRIDATVRSQVRGVLTPDQVQRFNQLQRQLRREMREQQEKDQDREQEQNRLTAPTTNAEAEEIDLLSLVFPW